MATSIQIDAAAAIVGLGRLASEVEAATRTVPRRQAEQTASAARAAVPVRTGTLRATVGISREPYGYTVTYGGVLPYARYIQGRNPRISGAAISAREQFPLAMTAAVRKVVASL
jgi:hypothetical protein